MLQEKAVLRVVAVTMGLTIDNLDRSSVRVVSATQPEVMPLLRVPPARIPFHVLSIHDPDEVENGATRVAGDEG